jgi:hypothetical protein
MATSKNTIKELTPQFVDTIKKAAVQSQGKGSKKRTEPVVALGAAATPGWVNSRLVLDQAVWNKVSRDVNADSDHYVKYYRMVIRPSLRSDQTVALAGELLGDAASVFNPRSYDTPRGNLKKQIQFAGPHQGRGVGFFEHLNLMDAGSNNKRRAYAGPGELYGPISSAANAFASQLSVSEYSEEDGTPQRIPGTMINTPVDSPFYTSVRQTDMRGTHVHDATTVVQKKWLVWRMAEIEKECGSDDIVRMAAQLGLFSRVNKNTLLTWINKKIPLLFDCWVVGMPFMRFSMGDGCWFLPGPNTARIGYNYENLILQLDGRSHEVVSPIVHVLGNHRLRQLQLPYPHFSGLQGIPRWMELGSILETQRIRSRYGRRLEQFHLCDELRWKLDAQGHTPTDHAHRKIQRERIPIQLGQQKGHLPKQQASLTLLPVLRQRLGIHRLQQKHNIQHQDLRFREKQHLQKRYHVLWNTTKLQPCHQILRRTYHGSKSRSSHLASLHGCRSRRQHCSRWTRYQAVKTPQLLAKYLICTTITTCISFLFLFANHSPS